VPDTAYTRLAARYIDAWNARDAADRRALVDEVFTPDARYTDPVADIAGSEAIDGLIAAAQQQAAGLVFTLLDGVEGHHDQLRFRWTLGPQGGEPVVEGSDVVELRAGRAARVLGFLDRVPATS